MRWGGREDEKCEFADSGIRCPGKVMKLWKMGRLEMENCKWREGNFILGQRERIIEYYSIFVKQSRSTYLEYLNILTRRIRFGDFFWSDSGTLQNRDLFPSIFVQEFQLQINNPKCRKVKVKKRWEMNVLINDDSTIVLNNTKFTLERVG